MSNWQEVYKSKLTSVDEAVKLISKNDQVCIGTSVGMPVEIVNALCRRLSELKHITMLSLIIGYPYQFLTNPEYKDYFKLYSLFPGPEERRSVNSTNIEVIPHHLGHLDYLLENHYPLDVFFTEGTPPDADGYMSFGTGGANHATFAKVAKKIVVSVNNRQPRIFGPGTVIHVSKIEAIVEDNHELFEVPKIPITEIEEKIARLIVDRIEDGSTVQIGFGGLANAIGYFLENKKDLGIHTEMLTDCIVDLVKKGVITGSKKTLHPGQVVCSAIVGSRKLYDFLDNNPMVALMPISYVNDPCVIAKNNNFVSINNALMVDLTGQVGAESIGFRQYSNTGGQVDFVRGAFLAKGKSYIALNATTQTKDGLLSNIVLYFPPGEVITTPRTDVDSIVTEYGIAELKGKSIPERVKAMINIAHPQFRSELISGAKKVGIL